jgi:hypothetical protein
MRLLRIFLYLLILAISGIYGLIIYAVCWLLAAIGFPLVLLYIGGSFAYFLLLVPTILYVLAIRVGFSDEEE